MDDGLEGLSLMEELELDGRITRNLLLSRILWGPWYDPDLNVGTATNRKRRREEETELHV